MTDVLERLKPALADRYAIEREVGRGGMATVYLAKDVKHHRRVALKVLRPELAASLGAERFLREIEIAAQLTHPNILMLIDSGKVDGMLYYVMPFVEGESLRGRLAREKQLPLEDALQITREVADALDFAHTHDVVHRDIKPENILLEAGHAVVADFGIAHAVTTAGGEQLTETGIAVGTPAYMSPEQASAEKDIDARSDVYSLGCVLYEMLAGETPYTGPTAQAILAKKALEPVTPLRHVRETVPLGVEQAVTKALAKVPADRYATVQGLADALAKPGVESVQPKARRLTIMAGPVVLMLAVALVLWRGLGGDSDTALDPNLVAVMPFRTAGADPSLAFLREGMMDLLAHKLTGEGGPRAADPGTVLAAWRSVASEDGADVSEEQAAGIAGTIGAGQLLLGSVVGSPNHLVLSATLVSASSAVPGVTLATVEGPEDSLPVMLDRLTGQLLAGSAGVQDMQGASLTTNSLEALKAYLDGVAAYRGGQYPAAANHLSRALGLDSTFTLAAFWLSRTEGWSPLVDFSRVHEIAWEGRGRLSDRHQVLLEAYLGPRGPEPEPFADVLRVRERAVITIPDEADVWHLLGDAYFHDGPRLGFPDWKERAAQAFERAVELEAYAATLDHLVRLAILSGDTTEIRRSLEWAVQLDATSEGAEDLRFAAAVVLGDEEMRADALNGIASQDYIAALDAARYVQRLGAAQYLDTLTAIMHSRARTQAERNSAAIEAYSVAMNRGRPRKALGLVSSLYPEDSDWHLLNVLYWNGFLEDTALVLRRADSTGRAPFGPTAAEQRGQLVTTCRLALWRLAHGETNSGAHLLKRLETGLTMGDSVVPDGTSPVCTNMVRAMLAVRGGGTDAMALVERVDSILLSVPGPGVRDWASLDRMNLILAGLFEELGQLERALAAVRRVSRGPQYLSTELREEGRLAALTGDREGAIRAYNHYLELRSDPEPAVLPEVEAVRAELALLVGEPE